MKSGSSVVHVGRMRSNEHKQKQENCEMHMATVKEWNRLPEEAVKSPSSPLQSGVTVPVYTFLLSLTQVLHRFISASSLFIFTVNMSTDTFWLSICSTTIVLSFMNTSSLSFNNPIATQKQTHSVLHSTFSHILTAIVTTAATALNHFTYIEFFQKFS